MDDFKRAHKRNENIKKIHIFPSSTNLVSHRNILFAKLITLNIL